MEKLKECPECGCKEIKQGKQIGYARMYPLNSKLYLGGSDIIAEFCSNCGYIISMKVKNPEKNLMNIFHISRNKQGIYKCPVKKSLKFNL